MIINLTTIGISLLALATATLTADPPKSANTTDSKPSIAPDGCEACDYNCNEPFDAVELRGLLAKAERSSDDIRRMSWLISRAGAEQDKSFIKIIGDTTLTKESSLALAIAGYDYAISRNDKSLDFILAALGREPLGSDAQAAVPLAFIDEWEFTIRAHSKHFVMTDGAGGLSAGNFWSQRKTLFPKSFAAYVAKHGQSYLKPWPPK